MRYRLVPLLLLATLVHGQDNSADGFTALFTQEGKPAGFLVRHWADIFKDPLGVTAWTVKEGTLTSVGDRGSWLISEKEYGDFVIEYEFKLGPRGNSGLALRAPLRGDPAFDGLEVQMADVRYNPEATPAELTGGVYRALAPSRQVYKPEEWNTMQVTLKGPKLTVVINSELVQDVNLDEQTKQVPRHDGTLAPPLKDRPRKGHIGFQELSRGDSHVEIRRVRIRELPGG